MEEEMLNALGFRITVATPFWFVCRYLKAAEGDDYMEHLAHYITERCLQEYKMLRYKSSTIAAAAVCLSRKILQKQTPWVRSSRRVFTKSTTQGLREGDCGCNGKVVCRLKPDHAGGIAR